MDKLLQPSMKYWNFATVHLRGAGKAQSQKNSSGICNKEKSKSMSINITIYLTFKDYNVLNPDIPNKIKYSLAIWAMSQVNLSLAIYANSSA